MYLSIVAYLILAITILVVGAVVLVLGREQLGRFQLARDKRRIGEVVALIDRAKGDPERSVEALRGKFSPGVLEQAVFHFVSSGRAAVVAPIAERLGLLDALITRLRSAPSWSERAGAASLLGNLGLPGGVSPLLGALRDRNEDVTVQEAAAEALGRVRDPRAIAVLLDELRTQDEFAQPRIASALVAFGSVAVAPIVEQLPKVEEPAVRAWLARVLGEIRDPEAVGAALELARDPSDHVRAAAVEALGRLGLPRAVPSLVERALRDPTPFVRAQAAASLGQMGAESAVDALAAALDDPSYDARLRAVEAIEALRPKDLLPLERALRNPSAQVRQRAALALERVGFVDARVKDLGGDDEGPRGAAHDVLVQVARVGLVESVASFLRAKVPLVRAGIAEVLAEVADPKAVPALRAACSDDDSTVRAKVATALGATHAPEAANALAQLLGDPSAAVCEAAAAALDGLDAKLLVGELGVLHSALRHRSAKVRAAAVRMSVRIEPGPTSALVRAVVDDPDDEVRALALRLVPRVFDPEWLGHLTKSLGDPAPEVQLAAVDVLGSLPEQPEAVQLLLQSLPSAQPASRDRIAEVLARRGAKALEESLHPLVRSDDVNVRLGIAWTLGKIGAPSCVALLATLLEAAEPQLRASAAGALGKIATAEAADLLVSAASDRDPRVRSASVNGLGKMEELGRTRAAALDARLRDPDRFVRNRAAIALCRVGGAGAREHVLEAEAAGLLDPGPLYVALALEGSVPSRTRVTSALANPELGDRVRAQVASEDDAVQRRFYAGLRLHTPSAQNLTALSASNMVARFNRQLRVSQNAETRQWAIEALTKLSGDERVDPLADALTSDPVVGVRLRAVEALGAMLDHESARRAVLRALGDPEVEVATRAIRLAGSFLDHEAFEALFDRLVTSTPAVRAAVVDALASFFAREPALFIARMHRESQPPVLCACAEVIGLAGGAASFGPLRELVRSEHAEVRAATVAALGRSKHPGAESELRTSLQDPDEAVRAAAVAAEARRGLGASLDSLVDLRQDPSVGVRRALAEALGSLFATAGRTPRSTLAVALSTDPDPTVRTALVTSMLEAPDDEAHGNFLRWLVPRDVELRDAVRNEARAARIAASLPATVKHSSPVRRRAAVVGLGLLRPEGWGEAVAAALADPVPEVRLAAATELSQHPDPVVRAIVPSLERDPDARVRAVASGVIARR